MQSIPKRFLRFITANPTTSCAHHLRRLTWDLDFYEKKKILNPQGRFMSFYGSLHTSPYTALCAHGPWIGTTEGHIVYDAGGYGMLGLGHNPSSVLQMLSRPQVMANIMTPNHAQMSFSELMEKEIGNKRLDGCPYDHWMCLNSGSEANTLAIRIANIHHRKNPVRISLTKSFHGRTGEPAQLSDSSCSNYDQHLASPVHTGKTYTVRPNDFEHFDQALHTIRSKNEYLEMVALEPVQGEGEPGLALTPQYYAHVRKRTMQEDGLLLVDSVQAGFRCRGDLSIVDAQGFQALPAPDIETFSKALTAGQYPMSAIALGPRASKRFIPGLYGNTMTANPRGLDVASTVLKLMDPKLKRNIVSKGIKFKNALAWVSRRHDCITHVSGTGLLLAVHLDAGYVDCLDVERDLRLIGLNIIHGGENAIRLTPWFHISDDEIAMIVEIFDAYFAGKFS